MRTPPLPNRRRFLRSAAVAAAGLTLAPFHARTRRVIRGQVKLGFDNFSIRAFGWKAPRLLEYAAELGLDTVLFSDLDVFERHDDAYLHGIRTQAAALGLAVQAGTGSICPTSVAFDDRFGSAEEHLALAIRVARAVGSNVVRCYLGRAEDRQSAGGIQARIQDTLAVCRALRGEALDAGVKIAIENHAGDLRARELVALIEAAGPDYVGATLDAGNATWALEDPMENLEILGPYAVSTGMRDSMVWQNEMGAAVQWTAMGEGLVDWAAYLDRFATVCPGVPFQLEIISGFARAFPYLEDAFWPPYRDVPAHSFARFVALARSGRPLPPFTPPEDDTREEAVRAYQRAELERSITYCKEVLGLGLK